MTSPPQSETGPSHYFVVPLSRRDPKRIRWVKPTTRCLRCRVAWKDHAIVAAAKEVIETGPSPEALAKAHAVSRIDCQHLTQWMCCPVCVALAIDEAKRSAHLEDARAGCYFCAGNGPDYAETPVQCGGEGWEHQHMSGTRSTACARPEVWDALSLLPGGQK